MSTDSLHNLDGHPPEWGKAIQEDRLKRHKLRGRKPDGFDMDEITAAQRHVLQAVQAELAVFDMRVFAAVRLAERHGAYETGLDDSLLYNMIESALVTARTIPNPHFRRTGMPDPEEQRKFGLVSGDRKPR